MEYFKEIDPSQFPQLDKEKYPDYFIDGDLDIERLFKYKDCYVVLEFRDNVAFLSIINVGKSFSILCCRELLELVLNQYKFVGFTYKAGIRNEVLIKRLYSSYPHKKVDYADLHIVIMKKGEL